MVREGWKGKRETLARGVAVTLAFAIWGAPARAQGKDPQAENSSAMPSVVPGGTVLPVVLDSTVSFQKSKPGQIVRGKIAQTVPLPNGGKIPRGAGVEGHIQAVSPGANSTEIRMTVQFDKVSLGGRWVHVVTDLRALAGFVAVQNAKTPEEAPAEGTPFEWLPTTQIGGDTVYGLGGNVKNANNETVGKSERDGVLGRVSGKEGTQCRGEIDGNRNPQALWVFSSDACGVYGIADLRIEHAGRSDPKGIIVLVAENPKLKLNAGDGLLLRSN